MPNLKMVEETGFLYVSMQLCIYFGLFTTLISNTLILHNYLNKAVNNRVVSLMVVLFLSFLLSMFGFEVIVGYIYSFIGVVGVFIVLRVLLKKEKRNLFSLN